MSDKKDQDTVKDGLEENQALDKNVDLSGGSKDKSNKKASLFDTFIKKMNPNGSENLSPKQQKQRKLIAVFMLFIFVCLEGAMLRDIIVLDGIDPKDQTHASFQKAMKADKVFGVWLSEKGDRILYQYKSDIKDKDLLEDGAIETSIHKLNKKKWRSTTYMEYDKLKEELTTHDLTLITGAFDPLFNSVFNFLLSISTTLVMLYFMVMIMSNMLKQMNGDTAKYEIDIKTGVSFKDVIGHEEVIEDIQQYIMLLKNKKDEHKKDGKKELPVKPPRGVLFTGPPGTGKTLLAKAMAGEAGVPFIYLNTSNVIEMFVGVGAKTIRGCFKKAREKAPCIVFLDEIDAIGGNRGVIARSSSEDTQTLLALLQELDGFSKLDNILVIAATNKPEALDPALRRSGRFDREIQVNPPVRAETRLELLKFYLKEYDLDETVELKSFAKQLSGMTGADIANICNEAAVINLMHNKGDLTPLSMTDLSDALDKLLLKGNKLSDKKRVNEIDRQIVAYHEAGHAAMTYFTGGEIGRVSTHPTTSGVGGFVMHVDPDSQFRSKEELFNKIRIAYAGRCSEIIKFGENAVTTGATNDIEQATKLLESMYLKYGFSDSLGLLDYQDLIQNKLVSAQAVYLDLREAADQLTQETIDVLRDRYDCVEALAEQLLIHETLDGEEAERIIKRAMN